MKKLNNENKSMERALPVWSKVFQIHKESK